MKRAEMVDTIKKHYAAKGDKVSGLPGLKKHELSEMMSMIEDHAEESEKEEEKQDMKIEKKGREDERLATEIMALKKEIADMKKKQMK